MRIILSNKPQSKVNHYDMPVNRINPLHAAYHALYEANEVSPHGLFLSSVPALLALRMICDAGDRPSQTKLIAHWMLWRQVVSKRFGYELIRRLVRHGYAEKTDERLMSRIVITVAGRTYLKVFEKHLRKIPK